MIEGSEDTWRGVAPSQSWTVVSMLGADRSTSTTSTCPQQTAGDTTQGEGEQGREGWDG